VQLLGDRLTQIGLARPAPQSLIHAAIELIVGQGVLRGQRNTSRTGGLQMAQDRVPTIDRTRTRTIRQRRLVA
jgi:hypothetical protein